MDECARMEEGRKLPGEEDCINVDSEEEDESTSQRKGKKRNKKPRDKTVMTMEGSGMPSTGKKAKAEAPDKEAAACTASQEAATTAGWSKHNTTIRDPSRNCARCNDRKQ